MPTFTGYEILIEVFNDQADQEEPHRTRRQLIQKAHPEVPFLLNIINSQGNKTMWPRTSDEIHHYRRRSASIPSGHPPPINTLLLLSFLPHIISHRRNCKPEFVPSNS